MPEPMLLEMMFVAGCASVVMFASAFLFGWSLGAHTSYAALETRIKKLEDAKAEAKAEPEAEDPADWWRNGPQVEGADDVD